MTAYDPRLHAFRPDLADARLRGAVEAKRYVEGRSAVVTVPVADIRKAPRADSGLSTQAILGDAVRIFDAANGWAWVQVERDGYVGYLEEAAVGMDVPTPTHAVAVPRTFLYSGPDLRSPASEALSLGSSVAVIGTSETRGTRYALLSSGAAIVEKHLDAIDRFAGDFVAVAETLLHTPYLWGGASAFGIDCSGLVQLAMRMAGRAVQRDSDMQAATIGTPISTGDRFAGLRRGDLVFWNGHVAIMVDESRIIHATGHTMMVSCEPLADAVERVVGLYGRPTGFRRPD